MSVKFWHLRAVDPELCTRDGDDVLLATGGLTVAYTTTKKDIMVNVAKCRTTRMIVKERLEKRDRAMFDALLRFHTGDRRDEARLHSLKDELARLLRMNIYAYEHFCYKQGAAEALKRLQKDGPLEILELDHPVGNVIADWVANDLWPKGSIALDYTGNDMGFPIDIWRDNTGNWVSDFVESEGIVVADWPEPVYKEIPDQEDGFATD